MKISFGSIYKHTKNTIPLWYLLIPTFKRMWHGELIYVGLVGWYIVLDFRGVNGPLDLVKALMGKESKNHKIKQI